MKRIAQTFKSKTARAAVFFYVGNFFQSILRYFFHIILLRLLTPPEYGEFLSYLSFLYLLSIPTGTITAVVTKFVAEFNGKGDDVSTNLFFYYLLKKISPITYFLGFLLIILANPLAFIFKAHSVAFIVLGISMLITLYQAVISSYLIAFQKFVFQTITSLVSVLLTIILAIIFIRLGLGATGAVLAQLVAGAILTVVIFFKIKDSIYPKLVTKTTPKFSLSGFTGYSFIYALGTMSLISIDILMVRALFDTQTSGLYSALSILGRMILFGLTPIISLVLPIATHRFSATGSAQTIFYKLGIVIVPLGFIGAGIFSIFPSLVIKILSGQEYLPAAPLLPVFSFSMVWFAFSQFLLSYLMATGRSKANILLLIATIFQPIVIYFSRVSIATVIWSEFFLFFALFVSLFIFSLNQTISRKNIKI